LRRRFKCKDYLEWVLVVSQEWVLVGMEWVLEVTLEWALVGMEWVSEVTQEWVSGDMEWVLAVSPDGYRRFNENRFLKFVVQQRRFFYSGGLPFSYLSNGQVT
jgi:hypothetical protein